MAKIINNTNLICLNFIQGRPHLFHDLVSHIKSCISIFNCNLRACVVYDGIGKCFQLGFYRIDGFHIRFVKDDLFCAFSFTKVDDHGQRINFFILTKAFQF